MISFAMLSKHLRAGHISTSVVIMKILCAAHVQDVGFAAADLNDRPTAK